MDIQRAKELLTALADGLDPLTGEVLPSDHVCNKGDIVRALHCVLKHCLVGRRSLSRRTMESRGQRKRIRSCAACLTAE